MAAGAGFEVNPYEEDNKSPPAKKARRGEDDEVGPEGGEQPAPSGGQVEGQEGKDPQDAEGDAVPAGQPDKEVGAGEAGGGGRGR